MQWRPFLLINLFVMLLFGSWFFPLSQALWHSLDAWFFQWANESLRGNILTQIFWALANIKITDLFGAVFIITFSLLYIFNAGKEEVKVRIAQFLYYLIWFEIGILFLKEAFFSILVAINFLRESPSLVFENPILLSKVCPWLKIKDSSRWCFPGDHAFIVLEWATFMWVYAGRRIGILAFVSSTLFIVPRLIAGAHWLSDILLGSFPIALLFASWALFTPLYPFAMGKFKKLLRTAEYSNVKQQA